ncbi:MAG: GAF domain-containing protein [Acidobacteriota bacterium]
MESGNKPVLDLARKLMAAEGPAEFFRNLATAVREEMEADWVAVWVHERKKKSFILEVGVPPKGFSADASGAGRDGDLLHEAITRKKLLVRRGEQVRPDTLRHLALAGKTPPAEIFCLPITLDSDRLALLEVIREHASAPDAHSGQVRFLSACAALAASAAASTIRFQAGQEKQLAVINRLMQLFDVSQVFHSSLERDILLPAIGDRLGMILQALECRIWLPTADNKKLQCAIPAGEAGEEPLEIEAGIPWIAFQEQESVLIPDLAEMDTEDGSETGYDAEVVRSVVCAPMIVDENCLGVVEAIRSPQQAMFTADDQDFLEELARQAAIALRNANLFLAESRAKELDALLDISREITSTLDIDKVIMTIVNRAESFLPNDRCAILLGEGRKMEIRAISGHLEIDRKDSRIRDLEEILTWAYLRGSGLYVSEMDGEVEADREETREKFRRYFEKTGLKTFVAIPLKDEEGLLGMLSVESDQPYFVAEDKLEAFNILANQATVAIRNAALYRQIPLINIMEPLASWRGRMKKVPRWKWIRNGALAAGLILGAVLVPWNLKIAGKAVVLPMKNSSVTTEIEGIVEAVFRREGDGIRRGEVLATLVDKDYRVWMEEARSHFEIADRRVAQYEAGLDLPAASQARIQREQFRQELALLRHKLALTRITSPVDGVVLSPRLERKVGKYLEKGEEFCRVADMREISVEVRVPETEIAAVSEGQRIRLKFDSFPTETFYGRVDIVGQQVVVEDGRRYLVVRGEIDGSGLPLKTGMLGRAKIETGPRSIGYVFLRKPARFIWRKTWSWLP